MRGDELGTHKALRVDNGWANRHSHVTGVEAAHMNRSTCLAVVGALLPSLGGTRLSVCVSSYGGRAVCGWCPLKAETGVRFPLGAPAISSAYPLSRAARPALLQLFSNGQFAKKVENNIV